MSNWEKWTDPDTAVSVIVALTGLIVALRTWAEGKATKAKTESAIDSLSRLSNRVTMQGQTITGIALQTPVPAPAPSTLSGGQEIPDTGTGSSSTATQQEEEEAPLP